MMNDTKKNVVQKKAVTKTLIRRLPVHSKIIIILFFRRCRGWFCPKKTITASPAISKAKHPPSEAGGSTMMFSTNRKRLDVSSYESVRMKIKSMIFPNAVQDMVYRHEIALDALTPGDVELKIIDLWMSNSGTGLDIRLEEGKIVLSGIPKEHGALQIFMKCRIGGMESCQEEFPVITILPNPKTLWKNLPPDASAPYPVENEKSYSRFDITGKGIVAASKRGRAHAHDGKFRDDDFALNWLAESGWLIVAVSDGAGSAKFSRAGARMACTSFVNDLTQKLSSFETNEKLEAIPEKRGQNLALERLLLETVHRAAENIHDTANATELRPQEFSATFLGYIAKKMNDEWLIVSVGIGDGAIALIDTEGKPHLLNEPDSGEYVGQTCFLTSPEIWRNLRKRTFSLRIHDFKYLCSMTDGVSDAKFETENDLKNPDNWKTFWDELNHSPDAPVHLEQRNVTLQAEMLAWLDFWSKGNHDDRTLTILY